MHIFAECIVIVFTNMYGLKHFLTSPLTLLQLIWMAVCENRVTYPQKHSPLKTRTISVQSCTLANWNNRIRFTYIYVSSSSSSWRLVLHSVMASDWIYIQHKTNPLPTCCRTFYLLHTLFLLIIIIKLSRKKTMNMRRGALFVVVGYVVVCAQTFIDFPFSPKLSWALCGGMSS